MAKEKQADRLPKRGRIAWLRRWRLTLSSGRVMGKPVDIASRIVSFDEAIPFAALVRDGLMGVAGNPEFPAESSICFDSPGIAGIELLSPAVVSEISMPQEQNVQTRQGRLLPALRVFAPAVGIQPLDIHGLNCFQTSELLVKDAGRQLFFHPVVGTAAQVFDLPHRRRSIELKTLSDSERRSFLHEGKVLKHLSPEHAELLAVFRNVPIEMISRLHFLEENKEILYSIPGEPKLTRTRLHDMAAIRDTASNAVHLVAHRTRSRSASLT